MTDAIGIMVEPFKISILESCLADLRKRLDMVRWPEDETVSDWSQGVPLQKMKELHQYWKDQYDWRQCEKWLNEVGQFTTEVNGVKLHFLHIRSPHRNALPMLLLHGWPGSVLEFRKAAGPLVDPTAYGGQAQDSFHLVIPSMPGYGFSEKPRKAGTGFKRIANLYAILMERLGYSYWVAQGGDWGADVCARLASDNPPDGLAAIHLNALFFDAPYETLHTRSSISDGAKVALLKQSMFEDREYGYYKLQATRPQTIGYSLADSPVGQASWIYEKLYFWVQHTGNLEQILSKDEILDNIMLYWLTNTGASSARLYWEERADNTALPIQIPVGVTIFPGELVIAPREWAERYYNNIIHWNEAARGGHFAAWEAPDIFVDEVRDCFRVIRKS